MQSHGVVTIRDMSLLIALPGPHQAFITAQDGAAHERLPAMPALEGLLARARRLPAARDWRSGVLAALGMESVALPEVSLAACNLPAVRGAGLCFAAPLHVVAGISRVHLPPGGWLRLGDEAGAWCASFNAEFGGPDLQLHEVPGGWLLATDCAAAARDAAPEVLIGEPLARSPAVGEQERALRRLGAEVEMWLNDHPLNRSRESRGLPVINCLWFWGGSRAGTVPPVPAAPGTWRYSGEPDPWLVGLAAHCGAHAQEVADWQALPAGGSTVLALPAPRAGRAADGWQRLDASWFGPAAQALGAGRLRSLRLQIGPSAWQIPDSSPLRWLRRRRPWYRQVAA